MFPFEGLPPTHVLCGKMYCCHLTGLCGKKQHLCGVPIFQSAVVRTQLIIWTNGGSTGPPSQNTGRRWPGVKEKNTWK